MKPSTAESAAALDPRSLGVGVFAYLWWGLSALYWALLQDVPAIDIAVHRGLWSLPFCALALLAGRGLAPALAVLRSPANLALLSLSALLIAMNWGLFVWAVASARLHEASLGYFLQPLVTVLIGLAFFGERPSAVEWLALGFAACGVLVFLLSAGQLPLLSLALAFSFAIYGALRKRVPVGSVEGLFVETLLLAPFALGWILWHDGAGLSLSSPGTSTLLVFAGGMTAVPLIAFVAAARKLPLVTVGLLFYVNPSCQLLLALLWFHETIEPGRLWSFALVWTGLALYLGRMLRRWHSASRSTLVRS